MVGFFGFLIVCVGHSVFLGSGCLRLVICVCWGVGFWLNWARVGLIDDLELVSFSGKLRPWLVLLSVWFDGVLFLCIRVDCSRFCAFGSIQSGFSAFGLGSIVSLLFRHVISH